MSDSPNKQNKKIINSRKQQECDNNNPSNKCIKRQQARTFIAWYKHMVDNERQNLGLYFADDTVLEWFGRTIRTKKKVTAFLKYDMQCSRHDFISIESIDKIQSRHDNSERENVSFSESPEHSPELIKTERLSRKRLKTRCLSPEWAEGCQPDVEIVIERKRLKSEHIHFEKKYPNGNSFKRRYDEVGEEKDVSFNGDGLANRTKRKCVPVTPPNKEVGQGDCLPSTSGTESEKSHDTLNAQLPKLAVECNGYIEFSRTRNSRSTDAMKWERKCKVQISYSEDPLNIGEYIIWALRYNDENKCRRNLLSAFEEAAKRDEVKNI